MATIYRTNDTHEDVQPRRGRHFTADELRQIVGGWIELVGLDDGRMMVCNEEGKLMGLPANEQATRLFNKGGRLWWDLIVGDVLVCTPQELES